MAQFDAKSFNPQAFNYAVGHVPNLKTNELKKSRALVGNPDIKRVFASQNGTEYAKIAVKGLLDGDAVNYDGSTNITATSTKTFERGVIVVGRAKAWTEKDFSYDITGGEDFMQNVAQQVAEYLDELDQDTILSVLKGVFNMSGAGQNIEFVNRHTTNISGVSDGKMTATTLNTATQKACGANKKKFSLVFMHSTVATNLENLNLLDYLKYTDENGVQRDLGIATWNGKIVVIDDELPVEKTETTAGAYEMSITTKATAGDKIIINGVPFVAGTDFDLTTDTATGNAAALKAALNASTNTALSGYTWDSSSAKLTATEKAGHYGEGAFTAEVVQGASGTMVVGSVTETTAAVFYDTFTTYVLGEGAIDFEDIGAKVPSEMQRDPKTNGGEDTLYVRQRKVFAPYGISYEKVNQSSLSPTNSELEDGANWSLVHSGEASESSRSYINHKAIAIARIISKG